MKYLNVFGVTILWSLISSISLVHAQQSDAESGQNYNITGNGRTAIIATERQKKGWYEGRYNYSPAVRAGDYIYVSGAVASARSSDGKPISREEFKASVRRAFEGIKDILAAGGADINSIIKITSFHVFDSPLISIDKNDQVVAMAEVKNEYVGEPHPAWTAIGTTALLPDRGLVEIDVIVYDPQEK
ncbi:Rid family hydrolase [Kordiimonas aquimaris]|uniref:Rid family hydrolase n=1 Tax=Kordiimonas aquimaris TaxID=707591 RepID=UPI0021CE6ACB|nr:Rid family hydrolase [Kordiimonas aquimaris]